MFTTLPRENENENEHCLASEGKGKRGNVGKGIKRARKIIR
jgi:hypothetical protein